MSVADKPEAYVFDSFALLAYLGGETGMPRVLELLEGAAAGRWRVNGAEVLEGSPVPQADLSLAAAGDQ